MVQISELVQKKLDKKGRQLLEVIAHPQFHAYLEEAVKLTNPDKIRVFSDSQEDLNDLRKMAMNKGGEFPLKTKGHTYHFDGVNDQGRDTFSTRYLLPKGMVRPPAGTRRGKRVPEGFDERQDYAGLLLVPWSDSV